MELPPIMTMPDLDELKRTEWSLDFEELMRRRLITGAVRYGRLRAPGKPVYDRVESMIKRLQEYARTKNKEHLVDVANLALCEFVEGDGHFDALDSNQQHHAEVKS